MSRFEGSNERPTCPEGYYSATIADFVDITERVSKFADYAFEMKLNAETVQFELKSSFFIKFDRLANGELDPQKNTWITQFNNLLDTLGYAGGFDRFGVFRDATGEEIPREDILQELSKCYLENFKDTGYPFIIYLEKDSKGYMNPYKRIYLIKDKPQLENFVEYKKKKVQKPLPQGSLNRL